MTATGWLSTARELLKRAQSRADHAFLVEYGGSTSHADVWPGERLPEERFEFNEGVEHESGIEVPSLAPQALRHSPSGSATNIPGMRLGGSSGTLERATCLAASRPNRSIKTTRLRPFSFGFEVLLDSEEYPHIAMSGECARTMYHVTCLVQNLVPQHVVQRCIDMWLIHFGVPEIMMMDERVEFESTYAQECQEFGVDVRIIGTARLGRKTWWVIGWVYLE